MSQGRSGTSSPTKGGAMPQPSMQAPFGNQNYRLPSYENSPYMEPMPSFETSPYLQPMPSPGGKGGQQPMRSPGSKGGQSRPPLEIQPYPMPSPGGKGGSYQRPPTPYGYGQPTFSPQQFAGYGQPSNIFSFNNPHYQPYNPYPIQPYTGNTGNPMINKPEVMGQNSTPITGNGGTGYSSEFKVLDPYGPGGSLEGQPRPTFPDPTQQQMPRGTVGGAPPVNLGPESFDQIRQRGLVGPRLEQIIGRENPYAMGGSRNGQINYDQMTSQSIPTQNYVGAMGSGLGSLFNQDELMKRIQENARSAYMNRPQTMGYYR